MREFPEGNSDFSEHAGWGCNKYPAFLVKWSINYTCYKISVTDPEIG